MRSCGFLRGEGGYRSVFGGFRAAIPTPARRRPHLGEQLPVLGGIRLAGARPSGWTIGMEGYDDTRLSTGRT